MQTHKSETAQELWTNNDTEVSFVSEIKFVAIATNGSRDKGSAFRAIPIQKLFLVSEIKFVAITTNGGRGKGSAFSCAVFNV